MKSQLFHLYRIISIAVLLGFGAVLAFGSQTVSADTVDVNTNMTLKKTDGTEVTAADTINQYTVLYLDVTFDLPNNIVHEGDTTAITIPSELELIHDAKFEVKDSEDNVVADAVADKDKNIITLTYRKYVEEHSDVSFELSASTNVNMSVVKEEKTYPISFDVNGKTVYNTEVTYKESVGHDSKDEVFHKYSYLSDDSKTMNYVIRVNAAGNTYSDAVINDTLKTAGLYYNPSSFKISKGNWQINDNGELSLSDASDVTSEYSVNVNDSKTAFSINLGDISEGFEITYSVDISYTPVHNEELSNYANLSAKQKVVAEKTNTFVYQSLDGSANGYNYTLNLQKTDEDGNPLPGAEFTVVRKATGQVVADVTTDDKGQIQVNNLLRDDYVVTEVNAPEGYLKADPVTISGEDFDHTSLATSLTVSDKKIQKTSVSGTKTWDDSDNIDGIRPESITVNLLANGKLVDTQKVSESDNWKYQFSDLPKTDSDGKEIAYTISEEDVAGYVATVDGYDLKNSHTPETTTTASTTSTTTTEEPTTESTTSTTTTEEPTTASTTSTTTTEEPTTASTTSTTTTEEPTTASTTSTTTTEEPTTASTTSTTTTEEPTTASTTSTTTTEEPTTESTTSTTTTKETTTESTTSTTTTKETTTESTTSTTTTEEPTTASTTSTTTTEEPTTESTTSTTTTVVPPKGGSNNGGNSGSGVKQAFKSVLPNTGEKATAWISILGLLIIAASIYVYRRKS
ncbi:LPXTG-motif cell wall-anchored protein [Streptococcus loxodontisalivarius]|uniref:LPXTG-motif cell wall-anchored protein n=1 Tax=Streptococcus loxodontisalivarius TaxID=1349415 RepID=A0ABS2PS53_9STRE|nr:Cna B-type domain-containing protein [Streptococcus loxodontisalivarius]MBM7642872.1 LPXTG-motif cell wall-anchored protein [Streptococcus loxodontisalivarius]